MKRYIITTHCTQDGKWIKRPHPDFGVYRSATTCERKLNQLVESGELPETGIGMGTVGETAEKLPFTPKDDYIYPLPPRAFREMMAANS